MISNSHSYVFDDNFLFKKDLLIDNKSQYVPQLLDVCLLGITIIIGGHYFDWNEMLEYGFLNGAIALLLTGNVKFD